MTPNDEIRSIIDIINESYGSTMDKLWVNTVTRKILFVPQEHEDHEETDVPSDPFNEHWVRAGFSSFTDSYLCEARDEDDLKKAMRILNKDYSNDFLNVYVDIIEPEKLYMLSKADALRFMRGEPLSSFPDGY